MIDNIACNTHGSRSRKNCMFSEKRREFFTSRDIALLDPEMIDINWKENVVNENIE